MPNLLNADTIQSLWHDTGNGDAFTLDDPQADAEAAIVVDVLRPCLLGYTPERPNGRAMLVIGGGGYTALMAGREGVAVARWLTSLGYHAYVLIHRFPNAANGVAAPLNDAVEAMRMLRSGGSFTGVGVLGLSSGGHLAACLVADYPSEWTAPFIPEALGHARPDVLIIGYAPISTNASGRTVIPDKAPLAPPEKQAMYDRLQPDARMMAGPPPAFIVYSASDTVVPVENASRIHDALIAAGGTAELHVFADAPHGFALDTRDLPVSVWPTLCEAWLQQTGF